MNWLAENALPIWVGGAVALTMAWVVFFHTRSSQALGTIVAVFVVTAALLVAEHVMETPREAVERTLYELADAVEANDMADILRHISPAATQMRADVEAIMPLVQVELANVVGDPAIEVDETRQMQATAKFRGVIQGKRRQTGEKGGHMDKFVADFERDGNQWLLTNVMTEDNRAGVKRINLRDF